MRRLHAGRQHRAEQQPRRSHLETPNMKPDAKPRIYIAAPYSKGVPDKVMVDVIDAAEALAAAGWAPFIPHTMTFLWAVRHQHPVEYWYAFDLEWLRACDALVRLPGESKGADAEVAFALNLGLAVYRTVEDAVQATVVGKKWATYAHELPPLGGGAHPSVEL